jgi:signal transduction histidine kinase
LEQSLPRYLLTPPGPSSDRIREALRDLEPLTVVPSVDALLSDSGFEPGWLFLSPDLPFEEAASLLVELGERGGDWSPVALVEREGELRALPVSPGFTEPLDEAVERLRRSGPDAALLSFRHTLGVLSRIRHDINNPLTAALAETQLLLMDHAHGSNTGRALRTVEEQLNRIRDMVAGLRALRPPQS